MQDRLDFLKTYYRKTDRHFPDRKIWTRKDREAARQKGQYGPSKFLRKLLIIEQYLMLVIFCVAGLYVKSGLLICVGIGLLFLYYWLTEFSLIRIEYLYRIFRSNNIYSKLLYDVFLLESEYFFGLLKDKTKKYISGYPRVGFGYTVAKYMVLFKDRKVKATLILKKDCVIVRQNGSFLKINDPDLSKENLTNKISSVLLERYVSVNEKD